MRGRRRTTFFIILALLTTKYQKGGENCDQKHTRRTSYDEFKWNEQREATCIEETLDEFHIEFACRCFSRDIEADI